MKSTKAGSTTIAQNSSIGGAVRRTRRRGKKKSVNAKGMCAATFRAFTFDVNLAVTARAAECTFCLGIAVSFRLFWPNIFSITVTTNMTTNNRKFHYLGEGRGQAEEQCYSIVHFNHLFYYNL